MSKTTQPIPPGHDHLIAHLVCSPCAEAIDFYKKAFGEEQRRVPTPDGKRIMHAELRIGKSFRLVNDDFPGSTAGGKSSSPLALNGTPVTFHQYVENCDAAMKRAVAAGATVKMPATDMFWGDRYGIVVDPFGHQWSFGTRLKDMTPAEVQASMCDAFGAGK